MQEIAYQLSHQTDTVFSIPEEETEVVNEEGDGGLDFSPPAAYLPTLISQLTTLKKPVVVSLDAFDLFAAHPRQALLYCLLDTVQSCRAGEGRNGLLVIGSTCVVNCVNLLEKRVKSRFSHRILKVTNPSTLDEFMEVTKNLLSTPLNPKEHATSKVEKKYLTEWKEYWATAIDVSGFFEYIQVLTSF
jgi:origin recognition complex subunit 4